MNQVPQSVERYDPGTFKIKGVDAGLRSLPPGEPERLGPLFAAMEPWSRYPFSGDALAAYLAGIEKGAPRFAIMAGNEIAGALCVRLNWLRGPYLQFLGVLPVFQNLRVGSAVLQWMEHEARQNREKNLWVCASDFNLGAIRFYERNGFVRNALFEGLVTDDTSEVLLRKQI